MTRVSKSRVYSKSRLKARMLEIFREIENSGEEVIVTDNGKPVLRIVPLREKRDVDSVFAAYRKKGGLVFHEAPDTPTVDEWAEP